MTSLPVTHLRLRSYLAPNMAFLYEGIGQYVARTFHVSIDFDQSPCDALDDESLHKGEIDVAFICGLPLVRLQAEGHPLSALSAPVLQDPRSQGNPVYFADVIVRADTSYQDLADLRGARFCYNDPGSNSGHHLLRHHLLQKRYSAPFFAQTMASGSHQISIRRVIAGEADCAAIDSAVLAQAIQDDPTLQTQLRIVESAGPCPIPPLALANTRLHETKAALQEALSQPDTILKALMTQARIIALAPVSDADYAPIYTLFMHSERANYTLIDA